MYSIMVIMFIAQLIFFSATKPKALDELRGASKDFVQTLTLLVGVVLIGSTIYAGIQYATAGGDSGKVQKAKGRLASNILVLALYIFSAGILNWLLPG